MNRAWIATLVVMTSLAFAATSHAQNIASANPAKIFNEMQETKDLKQQLEANSNKLNAEQKAKEEEVKGLQDSLKVLTPGAPQYYEGRKNLISKLVELDTWKKVQQAQIQDQQKFQMKILFDKIMEATKVVAEEMKLDLVVSETNVDFPEMDQINVDQLRALINQRNVIYNSKKLDISEKVTAKLDADYKSKGSSLAPAPAPAK